MEDNPYKAPSEQGARPGQSDWPHRLRHWSNGQILVLAWAALVALATAVAMFGLLGRFSRP
ncbi:MAG TPA: hypothetical protein VG125_30315 [Pirellulales bacterium]|nr:hypothetical protein [Pirellulales bacterium]